MSGPFDQPQFLTQRHIDALTEAERQLRDKLPILDKAEACGINCQGYRQLMHDKLEQIAKIKLHFGPKIPGQ